MLREGKGEGRIGQRKKGGGGSLQAFNFTVW